MKQKFKILAIETSCDETAAAALEGRGNGFKILSNVVFSQIKIHQKYGGVFPELASREHIRKIQLIINQTLKESKIKNLNSIDAIAVTIGPGLIGSLLVGVNTATALSYAFKKPLIAINHLEGHIYSNFISHTGGAPEFPLLALIVSGGHTELVYMNKHLNYKILGQTLDDAAGEAFDKVAKLLGLGYPGGPVIAAEAAKFKKGHSERSEESVANATSGIPTSPAGGRQRSFVHLRRTQDDIHLPRPMLNSKDFNFSFSGLKTAVLYEVQKIRGSKGHSERSEESVTNATSGIPASPAGRRQRSFVPLRMARAIAHEFQQAVIDILISKTVRAAYKFRPKSICLCGGVSANKELRRQIAETIKKYFPSSAFHLPPSEFCTDNAAMIAAAAYYKYLANRFINWYDVVAKPNASL